MVGGGYALADSELALLDVQPTLLSIRTYHRGRQLTVDGIPVSAISAADLCD